MLPKNRKKVHEKGGRGSKGRSSQTTPMSTKSIHLAPNHQTTIYCHACCYCLSSQYNPGTSFHALWH